MKTVNELEGLVRNWWVANQTKSEPPLARDFKTDIVGSDFEVVRCKDIPYAISFRIESGDNYIDGLLINGSGEIQLKDESHDENWLNPHMIG